jgi:hypothetical protein
MEISDVFHEQVQVGPQPDGLMAQPGQVFVEESHQMPFVKTDASLPKVRFGPFNKGGRHINGDVFDRLRVGVVLEKRPHTLGRLAIVNANDLPAVQVKKGGDVFMAFAGESLIIPEATQQVQFIRNIDRNLADVITG